MKEKLRKISHSNLMSNLLETSFLLMKRKEVSNTFNHPLLEDRCESLISLEPEIIIKEENSEYDTSNSLNNQLRVIGKCMQEENRVDRRRRLKAEYQRRRLARETPEESAKRRYLDNQRHIAKRKNETLEEATERRLKEKQRKRSRANLMSDPSEVNLHKNFIFKNDFESNSNSYKQTYDNNSLRSDSSIELEFQFKHTKYLTPEEIRANNAASKRIQRALRSPLKVAVDRERDAARKRLRRAQMTPHERALNKIGGRMQRQVRRNAARIQQTSTWQ